MRLTLLLVTLFSLCAQAQRIDFNLPGKESQSLADGFQGWAIGRQKVPATATFTADDGTPVTVTAQCAEGYAGNGIHCNWWKDGVTRYSRLVSDALYAVSIDEANNYTFSTTQGMGLTFTIAGLTPGRHTLGAYHNVTDGGTSPAYPMLRVLVNGKVAQKNVAQTVRATSEELCGMSYVEFTVEAGQAVTVTYATAPKASETYTNCTVAVNALVFDRPNPKTQASAPSPASQDMHADCPSGTATLRFTPASAAVTHHIMLGTERDNMAEVAATATPEYTATGLSCHTAYYWRVDEEDADGNRYEGDTWTFRPRRLAFPGAEGYGRFAQGGRGGTVYHVTSLDDDIDSPQPGTLRYGITRVHGPRTIVFDISGYITLRGRLTCSDPCVTIAGQTAPGKGITLRGAPFGMSSDGITRFLRSFRGYAATTEEQDRGLDGFGMAGNDHSIMDHCSIAWTTDEGFSSRNAKSITLQRTLIAEALNCADHPNYGSGTCHGFAGTIGGGQGGGVGSFHHNLLAHCEGRNWSISGGLTGGGDYDGAHDVFNNVVYNWGGRATDGGTHEMNFHNNYYRMGPSTTQRVLCRLQLEGTGTGTQSVWVSGNIRENLDGTLTADALNTTYRYELSHGQQLSWEPFPQEPFFPSYATVETAADALRNVLSDVGCSLPQLNERDSRVIRETATGTYSFSGSKTGKRGLIDREQDCGGYEDMPVVERPDDWDTDRDGMPDWWETITGSDPATPDNNVPVNTSDNVTGGVGLQTYDNSGSVTGGVGIPAYDNSDSVTGGVGIPAYDNSNSYTALEQYLNWLALPHYDIAAAPLDIDLSTLFAGYTAAATFTVAARGVTAAITAQTLTLSSPTTALPTVDVTATEGTTTLTRRLNLRATTATAIAAPSVGKNAYAPSHNAAAPCYNAQGQRVAPSYRGLVIERGRKYVQ